MQPPSPDLVVPGIADEPGIVRLRLDATPPLRHGQTEWSSQAQSTPTLVLGCRPVDQAGAVTGLPPLRAPPSPVDALSGKRLQANASRSNDRHGPRAVAPPAVHQRRGCSNSAIRDAGARPVRPPRSTPPHRIPPRHSGARGARTRNDGRVSKPIRITYKAPNHRRLAGSKTSPLHAATRPLSARTESGASRRSPRISTRPPAARTRAQPAATSHSIDPVSR